jgi:hypothetical protein
VKRSRRKSCNPIQPNPCTASSRADQQSSAAWTLLHVHPGRKAGSVPLQPHMQAVPRAAARRCPAARETWQTWSTRTTLRGGEASKQERPTPVSRRAFRGHSSMRTTVGRRSKRLGRRHGRSATGNHADEVPMQRHTGWHTRAAVSGDTRARAAQRTRAQPVLPGRRNGVRNELRDLRATQKERKEAYKGPPRPRVGSEPRCQAVEP